MTVVVNIEKLPKYAQDEIIRLRRLTVELQHALEAQQQTTPSRVQWGRSYIPNQAMGFLEDDEQITFTLSKIPVRAIRVRLDETGLRVSGDSRLRITCESSNCFTIQEAP